MEVSPEEVKLFIMEAKEYARDWLTVSDRSWKELKKRQRNNQLWSVSPNTVKFRSRYPAWYSIFRIRKPLVLSRIGIPIGRDTTQDGIDNVGATGAICLERLAKNLAKTFDFFDVLCRARDDFLATDFGLVRAYYKRDEVKERVKEYISPQRQVNPESGQQEVIFLDGAGKEVKTDEVYQDDVGYFIYHSQVIDVENEEICLKHVLYKNVYVDPGITTFEDCERLAFEIVYSEKQFIKIYGKAAFDKLPKPKERVSNDSAAPKLKIIKVFEYWDFYAKECYWLPENGDEFIKPLNVYTPDPEEKDYEEAERNGIYNLKGFFPVPPPLLVNVATDEFWPTPEYLQLVDILEDVHNIFSKIVAITKAIRPRLLFDNNVEGLQVALNEASATEAFGVPNLSQSLAAAGGTLESVAMYIPVEKMITALQEYYTSLEQRLNTIYKLSGTSDLLQGLITDPTQRTFGERQMTEKYALNQIAEQQGKMAEFVKNCYELMCEMALQNFSDASLEKYIMPQTLTPDHQQRYQAAMALLKERKGRFRIELETDSTIAINEEYDKQARIEFVNALTSSLEKVAQIAEGDPALVAVELHCLKYLIQGFRQAKMFQSEVTQAIDNVIKRAQEAAKNPKPQFNKDEFDAKFKMQELQADQQFKVQELQSNQQIEFAKLQSSERVAAAQLNQAGMIAQMKNQLDSFKARIDMGEATETLRLEYQKLGASISEAQAKIAVDRDALMVELRKVVNEEEATRFEAMLKQQTLPYEQSLEAQRQQLDAYELQLRERDQMLEARQQELSDMHITTDNILQKQRLDLDAAIEQREAAKPPELPEVHIHMPEPKTTKQTLQVKRDKAGNVRSLKASDISKAIE